MQSLNLEFPEFPLKSSVWFTMKMYWAINIHGYISLINSGSIDNKSLDVFIAVVTFGHSRSSATGTPGSSVHF